MLLVDEPGAGASFEEREPLLHLLREIAGERPGLALLVTARDVAGVAGAGRVLTLDDGRLRGERRPAAADVLPFPAQPPAQAQAEPQPEPEPEPAR